MSWRKVWIPSSKIKEGTMMAYKNAKKMNASQIYYLNRNIERVAEGT